jgi:UDP-N-acetyl-D-galactosamine dehydrogenase
MAVDVCDPWAHADEVERDCGLTLMTQIPTGTDGTYDAVVLAVAHREFAAHGAARLRALLGEKGVLFDMKSVFDKTESDLRL